MKTRILLTIVVLSLMLAVPALAAPKLSLPVRSTWDADMINSNITGYNGSGVYVAVLDTGLVPNWKDYFPAKSIATRLGKGFHEEVFVDPRTNKLVTTGVVHETTWIGSLGSTHGTHVTSTILGYKYYAPADITQGFPNLRPLRVDGIAPGATVIPVKVMGDYVLPGYAGNKPIVFGTDRMIAAGIDYATDLKLQGYSPMVISMSLGSSQPDDLMKAAIDRAIANGVIVVAAAGNAGNLGMDWPGAYSEVISVGANGWKYEWYWPELTPPSTSWDRLWWLFDPTYGYNDIPEPTPADEVYITDFSARELAGQQLDVVAPGSWVRGPFPTGYDHLPWWSQGEAWRHVPSLANFYFASGTSMATPHVAAVAAQMLEKDPTLVQTDVESVMKGTALAIPAGSMTVWDISPYGWNTYSWGSDAAGAGVVQADAAIDAIS